jgi:hypothetical protein
LIFVLRLLLSPEDREDMRINRIFELLDLSFIFMRLVHINPLRQVHSAKELL